MVVLNPRGKEQGTGLGLSLAGVPLQSTSAITAALPCSSYTNTSPHGGARRAPRDSSPPRPTRPSQPTCVTAVVLRALEGPLSCWLNNMAQQLQCNLKLKLSIGLNKEGPWVYPSSPAVPM